MNPIDWAHVARVTVWVILATLAYLWFAAVFSQWFGRRADRWAYRRWQREQELQRERDLLAIADAVAKAPPKERERIERVAESLGFLEPPRAA